MRTRNRQLAVKTETTPGTVETLSSSDVLCRIREGDAIEPDLERFETGEVQAYSSMRPGLVGRKMIAFAISYLLRGSAAIGTESAIAPLLAAAMLKKSTVQSIAIGSVTSGPFVDGETVTGGTSGATGRVFRNCSATPLLFIPISATFESGETITGGTSGASATSSAVPADAGFAYEPADSDFGAGASLHHVSARLFQDGFYWEGRGMLGNLVMNFRNGHPCIVNQRLVGAFNAHGDADPFSVSSYPEDAITPPRFLNASLKLGAYAPTDIIEATLTVETNPEPREDANDSSADGILFADYLKAYPVFRFEPAMVKKATKDYFGDLAAAGTFAMEWVLTGSTGSNWTFYADEAQFINVGAGDRRGLAIAPLEIGLFGTRNNEFVIYQH